MPNDAFYLSSEFQEFFRTSTQSLVLKANHPIYSILAVSDAYLALVHRERADIMGKGLLEAFPGDESDGSEQSGVLTSLEEVVISRKRREQPLFKYRIATSKPGDYITRYWTSVHEPKLSKEGRVVYIVNTTEDITEQIRQQEALDESERRFKTMAEGTDVLIAIADETGAATYFNPAWLNLTGRSAQELLSKGWIDLMHPEDRDSILQIYSAALANKEAFTWEFRMSDQQHGYRWLLARGIPRFQGDGSFAGYISSTVDIHDQKLLQISLSELNGDLEAHVKKLASANDELRNIQGTLSQANTQLAMEEQKLLAANSKLSDNQQFLKLVLESTGMGTWIADLHTGLLDLSPKSLQIQGVVETGSITLEDSRTWIDERDRSLVREKMESAINQSTPFEVEYLLNPPNGNKPVWLRATGLPIREGSRVVIIGGIQDITDQKANEQRKNDFIGMVSHELKTPLTSISGYIQLLQASAEQPNLAADSTILQKVRAQVTKMTTLVNGFLNVSRYNSSHLQLTQTRFDLAQLLKESEEESSTSITTHRVIYAPVEPTPVLADRDKISQVILNLLNNAVKYSPEGTEVKVACVIKDRRAILTVEDQGIGIRKQDMPMLFERYFRVNADETKDIAGFGIGLYLCSEIIKRHDGHIWAESESGKGSKFIFTLPVVA